MPNIGSNGELSWGNGGLFTTPSGETIRGISDSGEELFKYFRVAVDNGPDANGVSHVISLATEVGNNSADAVISRITETLPVEHPAVDLFTKTVSIDPRYVTRLRDIYNGGIAFAPETARVGLGGVNRPVNEEQQ